MRVWRGMLLSPCAVLLTLAGCSKAPEATVPTVPAAVDSSSSVPDTSLPSTGAAASEPPAESGLAIKRGIFTSAAGRSTFRPCGEQVDLLIVDQTDGVLPRTFAGEKDDNGAEKPLKLYIEAYGERATDQPAPEGFAGTLLLEEALYAAPDGQTRGCDSPRQDYIVAARGNEPFWAVEVTEAALLWRQPDEPKEISIAAPQTQDTEGAVSYIAANNDHKIELSVEAQACRDDMSGEYFAYAAKATLDGKRFMGCARVGE
ncbi:COG3650 family protein [Steroidobacter sp.]|uniref:COG3650 family protein n=1 Tax=Steroidobacter sp. TaxID=1978227 RepID=UPI001A5728BA|nr:hypothetical protein [Steroidobacter sp.]MBL8268198.1 hypothetical protein [Steroidobacter sp.]